MCDRESPIVSCARLFCCHPGHTIGVKVIHPLWYRYVCAMVGVDKKKHHQPCLYYYCGIAGALHCLSPSRMVGVGIVDSYREYLLDWTWAGFLMYVWLSCFRLIAVPSLIVLRCDRVLVIQGLDSSSAMEVLLLARRLATRADRRAVVASVHQPSAEMFALFDKVGGWLCAARGTHAGAAMGVGPYYVFMRLGRAYDLSRFRSFSSLPKETYSSRQR